MGATPTPPSTQQSAQPWDVLVVGAGPAGAVAALECASAGHRVLAIDRRPDLDQRRRSGALLSPRAVHAMRHHGVDVDSFDSAHTVTSVRVTDASDPTATSRVNWPDDVTAADGERYPAHAIVVDRRELDRALADRARSAGAEIRYGADAVGPIVERGFVRGASVGQNAEQIHAKFTIVADGADSRFGRALGTYRTRGWPFALAHRGRYLRNGTGPAETTAEFLVGLRDRSGQPLAGHAWCFPCADGTVVIGVLVMSTSPSFAVVRPGQLLERVVAQHAARWNVDPTPTMPTGGARLPLGYSVGPAAGPTYAVVGDAAGAANPLSGAGLEYAVETGAAAARAINRAIETGSATELQRYQAELNQRYGSYYKTGRLMNRILSNPWVSHRAARFVARRTWATDALIRISGNELRAHTGIPELVMAGGRVVDAVAPSA